MESEKNDSSEGILSSWGIAIKTTWSEAIRRFEERSNLVQGLITVLGGAIGQAAVTALKISPGKVIGLAPSSIAGQLSLIIIGLIVFQSLYFYRRFNRIEEELNRMGTSPEVRTDGGSAANIGVIIMAAGAGAIIGMSLAEIYGFMDYQVIAAAVGAFVALKVLDDGKGNL